jgi:DNA-binding LacI/PurR family transcriptional regulator
MRKSVRLTDIAERVGVSTVTVSKALAGKKGMSDSLRESIRKTAAHLGYEKTPNKGSVRKGTISSIGILCRQRFIRDTMTFYWDSCQRLINYLKREGYFGILEIVTPEDEKKLAPPQIFQDKKVGGVILLGELDPHYRRFIVSITEHSGSLPLVFLDSDEEEMTNTCIISDGYYGMYSMTKYLISMGHRNICFAGSIDATYSILDRYYGYCRAMREYGLNVAEAIPDRDENGVTGIVLPDSLPTAFACNCDATAAHLISLLMEHRLKVPGDISVVGFDDYLFPGYCRVPLTTWAVDMDAMANLSVNIITGKNKQSEPRRLVISGHIVLRGSVKQI